MIESFIRRGNRVVTAAAAGCAWWAINDQTICSRKGEPADNPLLR